jgi:LPS export ABC transporter permease LptG
MNHFFLVAKEALQKEIPFLLVTKLLYLEMPKIFILTIPMAILFGFLIGLGRLVSDSEIVSMQASGISTLKIFKSASFLAVLATILSLFFYIYVVPAAEYETRKTRNEIFLKSDVIKDLKPRVFYNEIESIVIYADEIRTGTRIMEDLFLKLDPRQEEEGERIILANKGMITRDYQSDHILLYLENGEKHTLYKEKSKKREAAKHHSRETMPKYTIEQFSESEDRLTHLEGLFKLFRSPVQKGIQDQSLSELFAIAQASKISKDDPASSFRLRRSLSEIHQRLAISLVPIFFFLAAFPLATLNLRGGKGGSFAISLIIITFFWVAFIIGRNLSLQGKTPIWAGIWGANLLMIVLSFVVLILKHKKLKQWNWLPYLSALFIKIRDSFLFVRSRKHSTIEEQSRIKREHKIRTEYLPNILDRYIIFSFLKIFVFVALSIYVMSVVIELRGIIDSALEKKLPVSILLEYFKFFTPGVFKYIIPISAMMASVVTIAVLSKNSEIIAIKATGVSIYRMIAPILIVVFMLCIVFFFLQDFIFPYTNQKALMVKDKIEGRKGVSYSTLHGRWVTLKGKRFLHYKNYESSPPTLSGVSLFEINEPEFKLKKRIHASKCQWNGRFWEFLDGWSLDFDGEENYKAFDRMPCASLEKPLYFQQRERRFFGGSKVSEQMSFLELWKYIKSLKAGGYDTTNLEVGLFEKTSYALTSLVMVLLALPFSFLLGKKGSLYGVGLSLLLIIIYWAIFAIFNAFGVEGILNPLLSAWAPNIIFGLGGIWGLFNIRT